MYRVLLADPIEESGRRMFEEAGYTDTGWTLLTGGIAALHWGTA